MISLRPAYDVIMSIMSVGIQVVFNANGNTMVFSKIKKHEVY